MNKQNSQVWGLKRQNNHYQAPNYSFSMMVWGGIWKQEIFGLYFFDHDGVVA